MTVIVYSTKHKTLASDSMISSGTLVCGGVTKIGFTDKYLFGAAGHASSMTKFLMWGRQYDFNEESAPEFTKDESLDAVVIDKETGRIYSYVKPNDLELESYELNTDFIACGSGGPVAYGALEMGASPRQAVEIASRWDTQCGGEIQELSFE